MSIREKILSWSLFAGATYFLGVSIVHMLGVKVPFLFIYYNIPSYMYQDRIISFLAFGWSIFMFLAARKPSEQLTLVSGIIYSGLAAIIGLSIINYQTNFHELEPSTDSRVFWFESGLLTVYLLLIIVLKKGLK
jgi:hypothetical protein